MAMTCQIGMYTSDGFSCGATDRLLRVHVHGCGDIALCYRHVGEHLDTIMFNNHEALVSKWTDEEATCKDCEAADQAADTAKRFLCYWLGNGGDYFHEVRSWESVVYHPPKEQDIMDKLRHLALGELLDLSSPKDGRYYILRVK